MAKPSWINLSKTSGSGDGSFTISAPAHTGRVARTGTVSVSGTGVSGTKDVAVTQAAKAAYVAFNNLEEAIAANAQASNITISGKSNAAKLKFEWVLVDGQTAEWEKDKDGNVQTNGINYPTIEIPSVYTVNGANAGNDTDIPGDPGASDEYDFSIVIPMPKNDAVVDVYRTLKVTADDSSSLTSQVTIVQSAGDARLEVSPTTINLVEAGTEQTIEVVSNTSWTVE